MLSDFLQQRETEIVDSLQAFLRLPSVKGDPLPGSPFGPGPASALEWALDFAGRYGFATQNVDGFAGHVEFGTGDEYVAVLSHLDVVPEGSGWTYPPFGAEIHDGRVYARGAIDDKGPAMSTLWALIALKETGFVPKRKIRLIFGLDEESGWECVQHYFSKEPLPLGGFTPDADFPVIFAEKGVATLKLEFKADKDWMSPHVIQFEGGSRVNMVPDFAYAVVECHSETAATEWEQKLFKEAKLKLADVEVSVNGSRLQICVKGVSAHGSTPDEGVNAITLLGSLLSSQAITNASMWHFVSTQDTKGKALGIATEEETMGALTSNLGRACLENDTYAFWCNIRYPINLTNDEILALCREYVSDKWSVSMEENSNPHYVPPESPVVNTLLRIYEEETGDSASPISIGGATYARAIPNAVAFGPLFPGQSDLAHQKDESWGIADYFRCIRIYAHAMKELSNIL